jgi:hypothetical protein
VASELVSEQHAVMGLRRGQQRVQDQAGGVDEQVLVRAGLAPVGAVAASQLAPHFARTEPLSMQPRDQAISTRVRQRMWSTALRRR